MTVLQEKIKSSADINTKPINLRIFEFTKIINPEYIFVGDNVIIDDFCLLYAKEDAPIKIGSWVHITNYSSFTGGPINIGNFVGISSGCRLIGGTEHFANGALMNPPIPEKFRNISRKGCNLKDFCFLGVNSIIFPGVTIGEGAVVGAGSIVRKDLEPWGVYIMKNGNMEQIKERNKKKTIQSSTKLQEKVQNIRLVKFDNWENKLY